MNALAQVRAFRIDNFISDIGLKNILTSKKINNERYVLNNDFYLFNTKENIIIVKHNGSLAIIPPNAFSWARSKRLSS